jgi:hypothetical protein
MNERYIYLLNEIIHVLSIAGADDTMLVGDEEHGNKEGLQHYPSLHEECLLCQQP